MARYTGSLGRPIQGISQQPNKTRVDGQCWESINLTPDVVRGLRTRTGSTYLSPLNFPYKERDETLHYRRDNVEEYFIKIPTIRADGIEIYDTKGDTHNLRIESQDGISPLEYLYNYQPYMNARNDIVSTTIADTTFLANNNVKVRAGAERAPRGVLKGVVYCQFMDYSQTQTISINGTQVASYTSPDGSKPEHKDKIGTEYVVAELAKQLRARSQQRVGKQDIVLSGKDHFIFMWRINPSRLQQPFNNVQSITNKRTGQSIPFNRKNIDGEFISLSLLDIKMGDTAVIEYKNASSQGKASDYSIEVHANTIFIEHTRGLDFNISTTDDADGGNLIALKGSTTEVSKLSPKAPEGMLIKVLPKNGNQSLAYWLRSETAPSGYPNTVWVETAAPDTPLGFNNKTMPITLLRESYVGGIGSFVLKFNEWGGRDVGDTKSSPDPSFLNQRITAIGVFQNRLYFGAGESLAMSRSSDFFNFYRTTTQTVVDSDPIDMYSDGDVITELRQPIVYNGDLFFFTDRAQVTLSGAQVITPSNLQPLRLISNFEVQPDGRPVAAGENIFFPFDYGQFSGVREFFTDSLTDTKRARPITDNVNQLIKGTVRHMATSTSLNKLVVQTLEEPSTLYVYDWVWQGNEKVQAAWGKWVFDSDLEVRHFEFSQSDLFMTFVTKEGGTKFVKFDLGEHPDSLDVVGDDLSFALDFKYMTTAKRKGDYSWEINHLEVFDKIPTSECRFVLAGGYPEDTGTIIDFVRYADNPQLWEVDEVDLAPPEVDEVKVLCGTRIKVEYTPSNPYPRDPDGTARSDLNRLQVGRVFFNYDSAGTCDSIVTLPLGKERHIQHSARTMGNGANFVGFSPVGDGLYKVPIRSKSDRYKVTLKSESHIPLQLREVEYDCNYSPRGGVL